MKVAVLLLFAMLFPVDALACSCAEPKPVPEAVAGATRVFLGKVASVERHDGFGVRVTFLVSEHFKGSLVGTVQVDTPPDTAMCGYPFQEGLDYVVYAHGEEGGLQSGLCSRTTLAQPGSDLEALRAAD